MQLKNIKKKIKQYENDIIQLIMENMLLKIENNYLKEKKISKIKTNCEKDYINNKNILRNQFYRSQEDINNIRNKSTDYFIKNNHKININNNINKINKKKHRSSKKHLKLKNNKFEIINKINNGNISNKSSHSNAYHFIIKKNNNSLITENSFFPLSCKKNKESFRWDETEKNIKKHKSNLNLCNIRKIKDEMDSIINRNKLNTNNKNSKNKCYIINEDSVEIIDKYSSDENMKKNINKIKNINNNMSNNIIHNTSINIFNSSKGLYPPLNGINYNYNKTKNNKNRIDDFLSLKNIYKNFQSKKKVFNNTKLNNINNNNKNGGKSNKMKKNKTNLKLNLFNSKTCVSENIVYPTENNIMKNNGIYNKYENLQNPKELYNFKYINLSLNKKNNLLSRNNNNSFYNNSSSYINNNYTCINTEYRKGEQDETLFNYNKNINKTNNSGMVDSIIPIHKKNNFIQRNKSFNCLTKLKKIIENKNSYKNIKKSKKMKFMK